MSGNVLIPLDNGHDVSIVCHAIVKAMIFECENVKYFQRQPPKERKEIAQRYEASIRFYEREYTRLINNAIRERKRHQGGIYHKATAEFGRTCISQIKELADNTIQTIKDNTPPE